MIICLKNNAELKMKRFLVLLLLIGLVSCRENSDSVIQKNIEMRGGTKNFENLRSVYMILTIRAMGMELPVKMYIVPPRTMRTEIAVGGQKVVTILLPDTALAILDGNFTPLPEQSKDELRRNLESQLNYFRSELWEYQKKGGKIGDFTTEKFRGKDAFKFRLENPDKSVSYLFVDKATYLNLGSRNERMMQGRKIETETVYSDYHKVGGFMVPFLTEVYHGKELLASSRIDSVAVNIALPPELFSPTAGYN